MKLAEGKPMERKVVVTGIGILCALGNNKVEVLKALADQTTGIKKAEMCSAYKDLEYVKVGISDFEQVELNHPEELDKIEKMTKQVLDEALRDAGLTVQDLEKEGLRASFSMSTSLAGTDHLLKYLDLDKQDPMWIVKARAFISRLAAAYKIGGGYYTTSSACAAGTAGAGIAFDLIRNGAADVVVTGGADHISLFSIFGFNALKSLSRDISKPFDAERDGINIGEASVFFIFEEYEHAKKRNARCYGEIIGYGLANDAYHITSPDPKGAGAIQAMTMALQDASASKEEIGYINAHGTGTSANDQMELKAIREVFGDFPVVSSTKSRTGHCLGAAGSIELYFSLLSIYEGLLPETCNSRLDMEGDWSFKAAKDSGPIEYALSNSFAFAGNAASILIRAMDHV
jgi:3-oxoacyl-[acyl-carrier-protein] synthase II